MSDSDTVYKYMQRYEAQINTKLERIANVLESQDFPMGLASQVISPTIAELCIFHFKLGIGFLLEQLEEE